MYRRPDRRRKTIKKLIFTALIIVIFSLGYFLGNQLNETVITYYNDTGKSNIVTYVPYESEVNASYASILIPAISEEGEGVTTVLSVQIIPGTGRVLANIDRLLFWTDTQNSIRTSSKVASNITGIDLDEYDVIYTIKTNATSVEGPSAGAALTIATIAALENLNLKTDVMITGAINHDGTIGPVSEILPKAEVAKKAGAELFLVPVLQSHEITYKTRRYCEQIGPSEICTIEKVPRKVDISEEVGIEVKEVTTVEEALEYFID